MRESIKWRWGHYILAVLGSVLILLLRLGLTAWVPVDYAPFLPYWGIIILSAWFGGLGPGLIATACASALIWYFQTPPLRSFAFANTYEPLAILAFTFMSMVISLLGHIRLKSFNDIKRSEERLAEAQRIARLGNWEWDPRTDKASWSDQVYAIFGVTPATFEPTVENFLSLVAPEDRDRIQKNIEATLATKRPSQIEHGAIRPDGRRIDIWEHINVRLDEQGALTCVWGTIQDVTEPKRAEKALRASEERFQWVMEATREGIWDWNIQTEEVYYSPAYFTMLGYEPGSQPPHVQTWLDMVHPDDRERAIRDNRQCIEGEVDAFEVEFRMQARSGEWRWILGRGKAVARDAAGRALRMVGTHLDITERKRYEEALRHSEEHYRQVTEALPLALWTARPDGVNDFCNRFWLDYTGLTMEESISGGWAQSVHPDDRERATAAQAQGYREGRPFTMEYRARRAADGQYRWFYVQIKPIVDEAGRLIKWVGTSTDVHDRKLAESAAHQERDFTSAVLDTAGSLIIVVDREGRLIRFNRACEAATGYASDEVLGKPIFDLFLVPDETPSVRALLGDLFKGVNRIANENFWRTRSGERRLIAWANTALLSSSGNVEYIIASGTDITDRRRAENELRASKERLEEADRRKDEFLAMLAHELRNPLAPIRNAIQVLRLAGTEETIRERQQKTIERQVTHMARLLDDLLDVSRITRGKIKLQTRPIHLDEVMSQAVETAAPLIESRRQQLSLQPPPGELCVQADWDRLVQVLGNLLTNASKYTDDGGRIWLTAGREGDQAVIRVRDSGIGISPELLPRVFDLFTQADQSLDRSRGGLGIGLTMVRQLTQLHGGRVEARSGGLGQGSEFIVTLPALADHPYEESKTMKRTGAAPAAGCCRILVVDDVVDSARSLAELLELWQQQVRVAHDGPTALEVARQFQPEVVLLDIGLPGMDGYEVARRLRWENEERKMLLVAMTGYGQEEDRQIARESGFDWHMVKPVDLNALHDLLLRKAA